jgi:transposase
MIDSEHTLRARREWVEFWLKTKDAGLTCRRFGISYPTLRKWRRRFAEKGEEGLRSQSSRPHKIPQIRATPEIEAIILDLRKNRLLGPKAIRREMLRLHKESLSTATIWKVLHQQGASPARYLPAQAGQAPSEGQALQQAHSRRPRPDGHVQDRQEPVPIHGGR